MEEKGWVASGLEKWVEHDIQKRWKIRRVVYLLLYTSKLSSKALWLMRHKSDYIPSSWVWFILINLQFTTLENTSYWEWASLWVYKRREMKMKKVVGDG